MKADTSMVTIMDYPLLPYVYHKLNDFRIAPVESEWPIACAGACGRVRTLYAHTRAHARTYVHMCARVLQILLARDRGSSESCSIALTTSNH